MLYRKLIEVGNQFQLTSFFFIYKIKQKFIQWVRTAKLITSIFASPSHKKNKKKNKVHKDK